MHTHLFARDGTAYDLDDLLIEMVFKDDRGGEVSVRMIKKDAEAFLDVLGQKLSRPPLGKPTEFDRDLTKYPRCPRCSYLGDRVYKPCRGHAFLKDGSLCGAEFTNMINGTAYCRKKVSHEGSCGEPPKQS